MGHDLQRRGRRVRRADASRIRLSEPDSSLSGVGGLVAFGRFLQRVGVPDALRAMFGTLKRGRSVVYPMDAQLRLLLDANVVGETRVFGLESLGADPLFVHLAGGCVPSIDTVYRDLCRFDEMALAKLELFMARHGVDELCNQRRTSLHLDIDTTVEPLFGNQEGALAGYNPRFRGRPSYHPLLGVVAETATCIGAVLRPGDCGFGADDATTVRTYIDRVRAAVGPKCDLVVRIDAAADCAEIMQTVHDTGARFIVKAKLTKDLVGAIVSTKSWRTVDSGADGRPLRQVAEIIFSRDEWKNRRMPVRVVAVRSLERDVGRQVPLWEELDYTVQVYLANDFCRAPEDVADEYDGRAEIEPIIGELKHALGIGKVPSRSFNANHAMFLVKLLAHNLVRRFVRIALPSAASWRLGWLRRALFTVPARLLRSGRCWSLRVPPNSALLRALIKLE